MHAINYDFFQGDGKTDENANEATEAVAEETNAEPLLSPAFPNGRRVSQVDQACCGGFKKSGICVIS